MRWISTGALLLALSGAAWSQAQPSTREYKGEPNRDIRVGVFANIRGDCSAGPLPTIRLVQPPANGKVEVKTGKVRGTNFRQCLAVEVPAYVAFYRSKPEFNGTDEFTLEIKGAEGRTQLQTIRVTIGSGSKGQQI